MCYFFFQIHNYEQLHTSYLYDSGNKFCRSFGCIGATFRRLFSIYFQELGKTFA